MSFRSILVPTDFSRAAERALLLAADIAANYGARIELVHITDLPSGLTASTSIQVEDHETVHVEDYVAQDAKTHLGQRAQELQARGILTRVHTEIGPIVPAILATAGRVSADLIVLGTHGRTGLARLLLGSVASAVVARSPIPVLTVRDPSVHAHEGLTEAEDRLRDESQG
jgi:nucleotide-binding universal stress UspA family protein